MDWLIHSLNSRWPYILNHVAAKCGRIRNVGSKFRQPIAAFAPCLLIVPSDSVIQGELPIYFPGVLDIGSKSIFAEIRFLAGSNAGRVDCTEKEARIALEFTSS